MRFIGHGAVHNAGLANQIQVMTSALMLGILTNRAFLVDWPKVDAHGIVYAGNNATEQAGLPQVDELLQAPFPWDFWEAINKIPEDMRKRQVVQIVKIWSPKQLTPHVGILKVALIEVSNRHTEVLDKVCCEDLNIAFPQKVLLCHFLCRVRPRKA